MTRRLIIEVTADMLRRKYRPQRTGAREPTLKTKLNDHDFRRVLEGKKRERQGVRDGEQEG
jgi:hypothetical protein